MSLALTDCLARLIVMTTATNQNKIPTWKEVIGDGLLIEYELKFDVDFSQRKHIFFVFFFSLFFLLYYEDYISFWLYLLRTLRFLGTLPEYHAEHFYILKHILS